MKRITVIIILSIVVLLGIALRFYNLGETAFDRDEFFGLNSSYGYYKTGEWTFWDFNFEQPFPEDLQDESSSERAEVFRWQIAQLYRFFEPSEAVARSVGAAWGVISVLLVYFVAFYFTKNKYIALIAAFLTAVGESQIIYSRRLRMYAMFFPAYLFFTWMVYKFYETKYEGKLNFFKNISKRFDFNPAYLIPAVIAGLISYDIHILTVTIGITILVYSVLRVIKYLQRGEYINKYSVTIFLFALGYLVLSEVFTSFHKKLDKRVDFIQDNYEYFNIFFTDNIFPIIGLVLTILGIWHIYKKLERKKEALFLVASAFVPLVMSIFFFTRTPAHRFIYFAQSFEIILAAAGIFAVASYAYNKLSRYKIVSVIVILAILTALLDFSYLSKDEDIYYQKNSTYPDFRKAFAYVKENKKPGDIMITRTYRSIYWRGEHIPALDIKDLPFDKDKCEEQFKQIISENPSGWIVLPYLDRRSVCSGGERYIEENLIEIKNDSIPRKIDIYRW